ncbi:MAG: Omp28-related outer membrane protein [Saprospiraceae bacterium]|nr:Omp28-related outer membrane protein [Saprospiraceae bacterium]MCB9342449.1 Omp28-related outer membrane protein [Lewinellaceae bacterium]
MKKNLLLFTLLLAGVFTLSAQHARRVLVEEFTNASCPPCASQNPGFNAILDANHDIVTPVKYQTNWPGFDPMNSQNPSEVATRVSYYGVTGVPHGLVDGVPIFDDCGYTGAPGCLSAAELQASAAITTPVVMDMSYTFNATYDTIAIEVSATSDIDLTGDLRLHVVLVEDRIFFDAAPGSNGEKTFEQPVRKMVPGAAGTSTGNFDAGVTKTYNFTVALPAYLYNVNQLGVSAWLQNHTTQEVFQSFRIAPATPKVLIPSSSTFVCSPGSNPSFSIINLSDQPLTTALLRYRQGNDPWQDYNWTGNLAEGESAVITLTNISITTPGANTIDVLAVSSNNGMLQTPQNEGYGTVTVQGLFDPGSVLPFAYPFQSAAFPPAGWLVENAGTDGWKISTVAGSNSTRSTKNNMFDYDAAQTILQTPKLDLTMPAGSTTNLKFDHAYTYYNASYKDSMRVDISADCGLTWTTVFHDGYIGLATAPAQTSAFTPSSSQWASHEIDITAFAGSGSVFVRFVAESGYGNNLYLDNVEVSSLVGVKTLTLNNFSIAPNPSNDVSEVRFGLASAQNIQLMVFDALGALVQNRDLGELTSGNHSVSISALGLNSGSYRVVLQGKDGVAQTQWVVLK